MNTWYKVLLISGVLVLGSCRDQASSDSITTREQPDSVLVSPPESRSENVTRGEIYIAVDESLRPVIEAEIRNFMAIHREATIHPLYLPGEEAVGHMMENDSIRLAITTRALTEAEYQALRTELITPDYAILGYDGIALVVHEDNPVNHWTEDQLRGVLTGSVSRWQELAPNEGLPGEIQLVFDHPQSSVLRFLRDSILRDEALTRERIFAQQSTREMLRYVAENPRAVGFGGVNWISDRDDPETDSLMQGLKIVKLAPSTFPPTCYEPKDEHFGPFQSYIFQQCYPLIRQIRSIRRESIYGLGAGFTAYVVGPKGQRIIHKAGLVSETNIPRRVQFPERENSQKIN